jgi:hypothetical protein
VRLMGEFGVRAMRSPLLGAWLTPGAGRDDAEGANAAQSGLSLSAAWRTRAMGVLTGPRVVRVGLRAFPDGTRVALLDGAAIARADYLIDASRFLALPEPALALGGAVAAIPGGTVEVMAHPGWNRSAARGAAEGALLSDPRLPALLAANGVHVGHYGELPLEDR